MPTRDEMIEAIKAFSYETQVDPTTVKLTPSTAKAVEQWNVDAGGNPLLSVVNGSRLFGTSVVIDETVSAPGYVFE